jgi:hypothetical protein
LKSEKNIPDPPRGHPAVESVVASAKRALCSLLVFLCHTAITDSGMPHLMGDATEGVWKNSLLSKSSDLRQEKTAGLRPNPSGSSK